MISSGRDIALRVAGAALASGSIAFAGYMLAYGGGEVRVLGMEHLAIFAQPRGTTIVGPTPSQLPAPPPPANKTAVDMAPTGSVTELSPGQQSTARPEIVAASGDRAWLRIDGKIVAVREGDHVSGLGRIGAIVRRDGGWAVLDDKGATLLVFAGPASRAALFSRRLIFD